MVLPILILIMFTLMLVMVHYYEVHYNQLSLHQEMLRQAHENKAVFRIAKRNQKQQSRLDGIVNHLLEVERSHRIYYIRPSEWIQLGEMVGFDGE